jgi:hypothetical protein
MSGWLGLIVGCTKILIVGDKITMENETKNELITEAEGNKLIAVFMGLKPNPSDGGRTWNGETYSPEWTTLKYHKSWDWLMPVWIKFRDLEYQERMLNHSHWRSIISNQLYLAKDPSELFPLLVNAIKWYFETQLRGGGN